METILRFDSLLTSLTPKSSTWLSPAFVAIDQHGRIVQLSNRPIKDKVAQVVSDSLVIPGFLNAHSHSFQYAMAGQAEYLAQQGEFDDFWTWRETMYRLASQLTPEDLYIISRACFSEMLRAGYTEVLEFHYLHNKLAAKDYQADLNLPLAVVRAAQSVGIGITLVPVFYHCSNFNEPATERQKRFIFADISTFRHYVQDLAVKLTPLPHARLGWGIHSLRAATPEQIHDLCAAGFSGPMHIHAAEQIAEVEICLQRWGSTPINWLKGQNLLKSDLNIVHATHCSEEELRAIAEAGAKIVLCPSTEGNLGDGLFNLESYVNFGGSFAIGTDSQININPFEELRTLDYQLRLKKKQRNVLCKEKGEYSAHVLLNHCYHGGQKAFGYSEKPPFQVGDYFDAVIVNLSETLLSRSELNSLLSALVYGGSGQHIKAVYCRGEEVVRHGCHINHESIHREYKQVLKKYSK